MGILPQSLRDGVFSPIWIFILPGFDPRGSQSFLLRIRDFDYLGATLSIAVIACLVIGINFGGVVYTWSSGPIIALFVLSGTTCIAFVLQQVFAFGTKVEHRMFPVSFLKDKEVTLLFVLLTTCNAGGFIPVYYILPCFQFARGDDPLASAVRLIPLFNSYQWHGPGQRGADGKVGLLSTVVYWWKHTCSISVLISHEAIPK